MLSLPGGIKELGLILQTGIAQDGHNRLPRPAFLGITHRSGEIDARGQTQKQTLLAQQLVQDRQRRLIFNPVGAVNDNAGQILRHARLPDAFGEGITVAGVRVAMGKPGPHRGAVWIRANRGDPGIALLQIQRHAGQGAARAHRRNKRADGALGLLPNFRPGRAIMGQPVRGIVKLIRPEPAVLFGEPAGDVVVIAGLTVRFFGHGNDFGAERAEQTDFFRRLRFGNDDDRAITFRVANDRQANARIARRALHNGRAGFQ